MGSIPNLVGRQWCHKLEFWHLIGQLPIVAVPCYSPEWKSAFGVNDEANKIRACSKITSWNDFTVKYV